MDSSYDKPFSRKNHEKKTQWGEKDNFAKSAKKASKQKSLKWESDDDWEQEALSYNRQDVRDSLDAG